MIPIARGQAIDMRLWPPCGLTHACWLDDAQLDSGETVVVAACGAHASPEDVSETEADINCMTCLVNHHKYGQNSKEMDYGADDDT